MTATRTTTLDHITTTITGPSGETDPADFDLDAIADAIYAENGGTWDLTDFDTDRFWTIVEEHAL